MNCVGDLFTAVMSEGFGGEGLGMSSVDVLQH